MDAFERQLRERLQALPRLRFSERSRAEVIRRVRRRRYRLMHIFLKPIGFVAALLGIFFLTIHFHQNIEQSIVNRAGQTDLRVPPRTYNNDDALAFSFAPLKVSHVQVVDILSNPNQPKSPINPVIGHQIEASITNMGNEALSDRDVQGMLFITKGGTSDFTLKGTWQDFVTLDLTNSSTLRPGETTNWHFEPMGNWYSNTLLQDDIHLQYVYRDSARFSSAATEMPLVWQTPDIVVEQTRSYKNRDGGVTVRSEIKNVGLKPLQISNTFAIIGFKSNPNTALMAPSQASFFADPSSPVEIKPGEVQTVNFTVIPIPGIDITKDKPQIALVSRR